MFARLQLTGIFKSRVLLNVMSIFLDDLLLNCDATQCSDICVFQHQYGHPVYNRRNLFEVKNVPLS